MLDDLRAESIVAEQRIAAAENQAALGQVMADLKAGILFHLVLLCKVCVMFRWRLAIWQETCQEAGMRYPFVLMI